MVKKSDTPAKSSSAPSTSSGKSVKINLDFLTSSDDSTIYDNIDADYNESPQSTSKMGKKHSLNTLKRRQVVKKRLNNVANSTTVNKYKYEVMVYMEKNTQMAVELDKIKQLSQAKTDEILDLKREQFELKEYINHLETQLDERRTSGVESNVDSKAVEEMCQIIVDLSEKARVVSRSLAPFSRPSSTTMNNTTMSRRVSSIDGASSNRFTSISPLEGSVSETMSKMQKLADEHSHKLVQQRSRTAAAARETPAEVDDDDDSGDELNAQLEEELQQEDDEMNNENDAQSMELVTDNNEIMYQVIEEEDEDDDEEIDDDDDDEDDDEELVEEEEMDGEEEEAEEETITVQHKMKTEMNKVLRKKVSFEFLNTPPRQTGGEFVIYNDREEDSSNEKKKNATYYDELENRPVSVNFESSDIPKRQKTPKRVNQKKSIMKAPTEEFKVEKEEEEEKQAQATAANAVIAEVEKQQDDAKQRKRSIKQSMDRRRSQVFSSLDSPNDMPTAANSDVHEPHIKPIEICNEQQDTVDKENEHPQQKKSVIMRRNSRTKLKEATVPPTAAVATVESEVDSKPPQPNHFNKTTTTPPPANDIQMEIAVVANEEAMLRSSIIEKNEEAKVEVEPQLKSLKRASSKTKLLKPASQQSIDTPVATTSTDDVQMTETTTVAETPTNNPSKSLKKRNSRSKLQQQESISVSENDVESESLPLKSLRRENSKTKLPKPENIDTPVAVTSTGDVQMTETTTVAETPTNNPSKSLKKRNSRSKLQQQESTSVSENDVESESQPLKSLRRDNSKTNFRLNLEPSPTSDTAAADVENKLPPPAPLKRINIKSNDVDQPAHVLEFKPPPAPMLKKPPLPKKAQKEENVNDTYVIEIKEEEEEHHHHHNRVLTEVSKKLDMVANQNKTSLSDKLKDVAVSFVETTNENIDPTGSNNSSMSKKGGSHDKANLSDTSNTMTDTLRSADNSINSEEHSGDSSGRTKRSSNKTISYKELNGRCKMRRDEKNNVVIKTSQPQ